MHLDTVCTMVDVDEIVMYPNVADTLSAHAVTLPASGRRRRPGARRRRRRAVPRRGRQGDGIDTLRQIDTGLDPVTAEREQWDDGNNTLAIAPRVAVAYERNVETNARLEEAGIEVVGIAGSELGSGRGGPRCMSCPVSRDPLPEDCDRCSTPAASGSAWWRLMWTRPRKGRRMARRSSRCSRPKRSQRSARRSPRCTFRRAGPRSGRTPPPTRPTSSSTAPSPSAWTATRSPSSEPVTSSARPAIMRHTLRNASIVALTPARPHPPHRRRSSSKLYVEMPAFHAALVKFAVERFHAEVADVAGPTRDRHRPGRGPRLPSRSYLLGERPTLTQSRGRASRPASPSRSPASSGGCSASPRQRRTTSVAFTPGRRPGAASTAST